MQTEIRFRKGQDAVMEYNGGYMAVPSVPGAGKTFVLTHLTARLIEERRQIPGKILIVTYMNSAVANFKDRIYNLLKEKDLNPMEGYEVMTLHTLAMKILKEKPDKLLLDDGFTVLDERTQAELLRDIYARWKAENRREFYALIDDGKYSHQSLNQMEERWAEDFYRLALGSFEYFKIQGYDAKAVLELVKRSEDMPLLKWIQELYREYEIALKHGGFIDFNDILIGALNLLKEDDMLLKRYQGRYTYIFEDEAQDSNIIQQEILMMLTHRSKNLVRVGDSNQAIMSTFTISDPKLFRDFANNSSTQVKSINMASRSCEHVIDLANFFVNWTGKHHPCADCRDSLEEQYIKPVDDDDPFPNPVVDDNSVYFLEFKNLKAELEHIAKRCSGHVQKFPEKSIAVLLPANWMAAQLVDELEKVQVPYREITRFPKERAYAANTIGAVLDFIIHPYESGKLKEVIKYILEEDVEQEELDEIYSFLDDIPLENLLYPLSEHVQRETIPSRLQDMIPLFREFLEISSEMPEYLVLHIAERLNFDGDRMAIAQKIASDIHYLVSQNPDWTLMHLAQELKSIENSYNHFANVVYDMQGFEPKPGEVTISTLHKAKGLEWDTVFLACMTAYNFPARLNDKFRGECYYLKEEYQNPEVLVKAQFDNLMGVKDSNNFIDESKIDIISERVRLLYVGITRAKEYLIMTSNNTHSMYFNVFKQYLLHKKQNIEVES